MLDALIDLFDEPQKLFGILQVYGEETIIQTSNEYAETKTIDIKTTKLQKRQGRGGQSQNRIARLRIESINNYLKLAAEKASSIFIKNGLPTINALLIIGPGLKKEQIIDYLAEPLKTIPLFIRSTDSTSTPITKHLLEMICTESSDIKSRELSIIEDLLIKSPDILAFGNELSNIDEIKAVYDNPLIQQRFGGPVGIRYFSPVNQ